MISNKEILGLTYIGFIIGTFMIAPLQHLPVWIGIIHHVGWIAAMIVARNWKPHRSGYDWLMHLSLCYIAWPAYLIIAGTADLFKKPE